MDSVMHDTSSDWINNSYLSEAGGLHTDYIEVNVSWNLKLADCADDWYKFLKVFGFKHG